MFDDEGIERSPIIGPALTKAITESRISIVILSQRYASSSWCLDELVEILRCEKDIGQIVMPIFYGVDPSHVEKQTEEFGSAFNKTCDGRTEKERRIWSQALTDAANIAGVDFQNCKNEAEMIANIAKDVLDKLIATPSRDFDGMVGLESHLREIESLLDLDKVEVKMVGIYGPAGIGKSTIARALHNIYSSKFQHTIFVDNLGESVPIGNNEYGVKLRLQNQVLSKVLNQDGISICHLGVLKERLKYLRVLIILDDVNNIKQLEALANECTWFGPRSRIVIITENKELLEQHGINNIYHVGFPSDEEALMILCKYAFKQIYPHNGFKKLALRVTELCDNLPLGLSVVGSSLRGKMKDEWEYVIRKLDTIIDRNIEEVLRVGYESLHENEQYLFLYIAVFFSNYKDRDFMEAMFADNNLEIKHELQILTNKSLIGVYGDIIVMHKLLQQVGTKAIQREKRWQRRILMDTSKICNILECTKGTKSYRAVSGVSFDIYGVNEVSVNKRAFKNTPNLRFLKVYKSKDDGNDILHISEEMELPQRLRLLHWEAYPSKCFPPGFSPKFLVELDLQNNLFEKLWEGSQHLQNLRKMDLFGSTKLMVLPDLSDATNLEELTLGNCESLAELPSSIENLHKLRDLYMAFCINLQNVPTNLDLASLEIVDMFGCSHLRDFPNISRNIEVLTIADTMLEKLPESVGRWSCLQVLNIMGSVATLSYVPNLNRSEADIERIPDCIKDLHRLEELYIYGCPKLASLPELPRSLKRLTVNNCESLETLMFLPFHPQIEILNFVNCSKVGKEAHRVITEQSNYVEAILPGKEMLAECDHRVVGTSLTIHSDFKRYRICIAISPKQRIVENDVDLWCRIRLNNLHIVKKLGFELAYIKTEHLFMFPFEFLGKHGWLEQNNKILFEFRTTSENMEITECGVQIFGYETDDEDDDEENLSDGSNELDEPKQKRLKT